MEQKQSNASAKKTLQLKLRYFAFGGLIFSTLSVAYFSLTETIPIFSFDKIKSGRIDWKEDAIPLFNNYKDHEKRFRVKDTTDNSEIKTLKAVRFDSKHLDSLINYAPGKKAPYVYLYFGMEKKEIQEGLFTSHPRYKIVAVAADSVNKQISLLTNLVYDKADPCPEKCPSNSPY